MPQSFLDLLIDVLLDEGFTLDEASKLIALREDYERRRAMQLINHLHFIRWLVEHKRISDWD